MNSCVDLSLYDNFEYRPGCFARRLLWFVVSILFFQTLIPWPSFFKCFLLRVFGAEIGKKVVIKPLVLIKYPWFLKISDFSWIGEKVWIDNLVSIKIGANVCISQGAYLLTGSHDYKKKSFDLLTNQIVVNDGCWIAAKSIICPGVTCGTHSVLTAGSVAVSDLEAYSIYQGNPAEFKKKRELR